MSMRQRLVQYRSAAGDIKSDWVPSDVVPGDVLVVDGVKYERIVHALNGHSRSRGLQLIQDERPVVSNSSPRWHGMNVTRGGFYKHYTKEGKPVRTSRADLREAQLKAADHGERIERARDVWGDE